MNSMQLPLVIIFFMTYFTGLGAMAPSAPLDLILEHILLTPKYLDQFLMVLHAIFTTGLIFVRQLKQGAATLCFNRNYTSF